MNNPTISMRPRLEKLGPLKLQKFTAWALAFLLALTAPLVPLHAEGEAAFVAGIEDLPLMAGLEEVPDSGVVFDKPSGRIVEAYARGRVTRQAVLKFYTGTLPQLGWRRDGDVAFHREGERLTLNITTVSGILTIRFTLSPN